MSSYLTESQRVVAVSGSQRPWNVLLCLQVCCFLRNRAWLIVTIAIQAEAAAKKALLDAKDVMRENRKRKNSSKNTSKSSRSFLRNRAWLIATIAIQAEAAAKKALLDAKDVMRENRKRKNSSKNTSKSSRSFVAFLCIANCSLESKADKAAAAKK